MKNTKQQVKPAQITEQKTPTPTVEERTTSTIQVSVENKGRLDTLKQMLNQPDYNSTLSRIIDIIPQKLSTEEEVHLIMPVSRYRWLMMHQDNCDCRNALNDAKV